VRFNLSILLLGLLASLLTANCGGYGSKSNNMMTNPGMAPAITQLVPNSAMSGGSAFMLTVNGSNFGTDAIVYWGSTVRNTTYVSGNQLMAAIAASDIAMKATIPVYVRTNGQNSNPVNFMVN
jgi:hypothetical protein